MLLLLDSTFNFFLNHLKRFFYVLKFILNACVQLILVHQFEVYGKIAVNIGSFLEVMHVFLLLCFYVVAVMQVFFQFSDATHMGDLFDCIFL